LVWWDNFLDNASAIEFGCTDPFARVHHLSRFIDTKQTLAVATAAQQTDVNLWKANLCVL
jgi:hypothetical protein